MGCKEQGPHLLSAPASSLVRLQVAGGEGGPHNGVKLVKVQEEGLNLPAAAGRQGLGDGDSLLSTLPLPAQGVLAETSAVVREPQPEHTGLRSTVG